MSHTKKIGLAAMSKERRTEIAKMGGASHKGRKPWNLDSGSGWIDANGYRMISIVRNGKRRQIRHHRYVMELHLGRPLEPWELVHHKDGCKSNNEISNLEITTWPDHTAHHHLGSRRDETLRRSTEAFANMRWEMGRVRDLNRDLLAACKRMLRLEEASMAELSEEGYVAGMADYDALVVTITMLRAAIAKAEPQPEVEP